MTPRRERMVRGRKAPNILRCTRTEWMAAWEDAVRQRPRLIIIVGDHNKNGTAKESVTQKTQNLDTNLDIK